MASATLIKRFAKRDRRIGSGVENGILCLLSAFRSGGEQGKVNMPASDAEHHSHTRCHLIEEQVLDG
jgi:hypothetical protein